MHMCIIYIHIKMCVYIYIYMQNMCIYIYTHISCVYIHIMYIYIYIYIMMIFPLKPIYLKKNCPCFPMIFSFKPLSSCPMRPRAAEWWCCGTRSNRFIGARRPCDWWGIGPVFQMGDRTKILSHGRSMVLLWMEEILHRLIGCLSHSL